MARSRISSSLLTLATFACAPPILMVTTPAAAQAPAAEAPAAPAAQAPAAETAVDGIPEADAEASSAAGSKPAAEARVGFGAPADSAKKPAADATADGVPRDPRGIQGISPFYERLLQGDGAYLGRNYEKALEHYQAAVALEPQQVVGHLRMAETFVRLENLEQAEASLRAGLRFVGDDLVQKTKLYFQLADLRERQRAFDEGIAAWTAYAALAQELPPPEDGAVKGKAAHAKAPSAPPARAVVYEATAVERKKRLEEQKKLQADYAAVKERIQERLEEADAAAKKNAK